MEQTAANVDSDVYSPQARQQQRGQLASDVEEFLNSGGKVSEVPKGERADPPKKPENNYGRGSI